MRYPDLSISTQPHTLTFAYGLTLPESRSHTMPDTVAVWPTGVGVTDGDVGETARGGVEWSQAVVPRNAVMLTAPMSAATRAFMMRSLSMAPAPRTRNRWQSF